MDVKKHIYKIKRVKDGLYSNGSTRPSFNDTGKLWSTAGKLKMHLSCQSKKKLWPYTGCIVEVLVTSVDNEKTEAASDIVNAYEKLHVVNKLSGKLT